MNFFFDYVDLQNLSWEEIQFGIDLPNKRKRQVVNHVMILVKYFLFLGRKRNTPPTEHIIKNRIDQDRLQEKKLAILHNSLPLHFKKWENWLLYIENIYNLVLCQHSIHQEMPSLASYILTRTGSCKCWCFRPPAINCMYE